MADILPKTGEMIENNQLVDYVLQEVGDPELSRVSVKNIVERLDSDDFGFADGFVAVKSQPQIDQFVEDAKDKNTPNILNRNKTAIKSALWRRVADLSNSDASPWQVDDFAQRLHENAYIVGIQLDEVLAGKIAQKISIADGQEGKTIRPKLYRPELEKNVLELITPWLREANFSEEDIGKLSRATAVALSAKIEFKPLTQYREDIPYPLPKSLSSSDLVTSSGLTVGMVQISPDDIKKVNNPELLAYIDQLIPTLKEYISSLNRRTGISKADRRLLAATVRELILDLETIKTSLKDMVGFERAIAQMHIHEGPLSGNALRVKSLAGQDVLLGRLQQLSGLIEKGKSLSAQAQDLIKTIRSDCAQILHLLVGRIAVIARFLPETHRVVNTATAASSSGASSMLGSAMQAAQGSKYTRNTFKVGRGNALILVGAAVLVGLTATYLVKEYWDKGSKKPAKKVGNKKITKK